MSLVALEKPNPIVVLQSNALLKAISSESIEELSRVSRPVRAEKGEILWFNGSQVDYVGLSATGFVKMVRTNSTGTDVTIELFGPGHIFGLMGAITGTGCPLTARAISDLWYLRIPKSAILDIYGNSIALKDALIRKSAMRLHGAVELMARLSSGKVEERIAAILFIVAETYAEKDSAGIRLKCPLTRQEISEMAGTTVESTIRVMSRWQKEGFVTTDRQQIIIRDEKRLNDILVS